MSTENNHGAGSEGRKAPRPIEMGEIVKAYVDELAEQGEEQIDQRAASAMDSIIARFQSTDLDLLSWKDITEKFPLETAETQAQQTVGEVGEFAITTRSGSAEMATGGLTIFTGELDETVYSVELIETSDVGRATLELTRDLSSTSTNQQDGPVTVHFPDGTSKQYEIGPEGVSIDAESSTLDLGQFDDIDWIEIGLSDGMNISLTRI